MRKNLTIECFRGLTRQNELIEIGLTNHFDCIDVDMNDMLDRSAAMGKKFACQFIKSAGIEAACFDLPIDVAADEEQLATELGRVQAIVELAQEIRATRARLEIGGTGPQVYHETFERVRQRIGSLADTFAAAGVSIGLMLQRDPSLRRYEYQFVQKADELLTLIKLVGKKNVGLALDTCSWVAAGGSVDSLRKVPLAQWVDVQLCDCAADGSASRCLPGTQVDSIAVDVVRYLAEIGYEGSIAATAQPNQVGQSKPSAIGARLAEALQDILAKANSATAELAAN